jgi:molybdate transport system substrate-binding protein
MVMRLVVLIALLLPALAAPQARLLVAAAANLQPALAELKAEFRTSTGLDVEAVYGASGRLATQVLQGAPFDVFVSADMEFPDSLFRRGFAAEAPRPYASGRLVLWTARPRSLESGLAGLLDPALSTLAIPDPRRAPYGREAVRALVRAGVHDKVKAKLVFGENTSQAAQYVITGHADAAITAKSVALAPDARGKGSWVELDTSLHDPILQGAVICRHGSEKHPEAAARFLAFLFTEPARRIFARYGYALP